ncbi:Hexokinase-1-like protein [Cladobotryum mycophilum]|uniref:Phosphotransferase n=1 Tax=Cladobotryum mycophilum TaxID=491253 RepID=A0ABR0T329_9HYPO
MASQAPLSSLNRFLEPFNIDVDTCHALSERFLQNFAHLAAESKDQFLPTPISESILRPVAERGQGRHLAIDIGGTNLRVGFVELHGTAEDASNHSGQVQRLLEKSWPIANHLKNDNADSLFDWIGKCIAEVVEDGTKTLELPKDKPVSLGVTFSFPMVQKSVSQATLMSMGKGFALPESMDLGSRLEEGYAKFRHDSLPPLKVTAIANDSVSTLVSFIFNYDGRETQRAAMGLILGTGSNATVPLKLSLLHPSKRPEVVSVLPGESLENATIAVNTEWSINGTAPPLRELGLISKWDDVLSAQNETPGFQPLEYMTAGRYLGELGRIMLMDYMTSILDIPAETLPSKLLGKHNMTTTFLSHYKPLEPASLLTKLEQEFPESTGASGFKWTEEVAVALYHIAKAIEVRAAGIIAAAILALLTLAEEIPAGESPASEGLATQELGVGYTGGCIVHFQDYLVDCQSFVDQLVTRKFGDNGPLRVVLSPCHDGGVTGAGILVAAEASSSKQSEA